MSVWINRALWFFAGAVTLAVAVATAATATAAAAIVMSATRLLERDAIVLPLSASASNDWQDHV